MYDTYYKKDSTSNLTRVQSYAHDYTSITSGHELIVKGNNQPSFMANDIREETQSDYGSDIDLDDVILNLLDSATVQRHGLPPPPTTDFAAPTQSLQPHGPGAETRPVSGLGFSSGEPEHPTQLQSTLDQPFGKSFPICDTRVAWDTNLARYAHGRDGRRRPWITGNCAASLTKNKTCSEA